MVLDRIYGFVTGYVMFGDHHDYFRMILDPIIAIITPNNIQKKMLGKKMPTSSTNFLVLRFLTLTN